MARHDPAKIVTDLAIVLGLGGDCLADIAVLRGEPGVFGPVASDPTVSRTIDALAGDVERVLNAIIVARAAARARVWALGNPNACACGCSRPPRGSSPEPAAAPLCTSPANGTWTTLLHAGLTRLRALTAPG